MHYQLTAAPFEFIVHNVDVIKGWSELEHPNFQIIASTILFVRRPDSSNIFWHLDDQFRLTNGTNFQSFQKQFTVVIDSAAVMARVAGSTIRTRVILRDKTWIHYYVHVLLNCMKSSFIWCNDDSVLIKIIADMKSVKNRRRRKRIGWNKNLPHEHPLIEDLGNRLGNFYLVAVRFLKSAKKAWNIILTQDRTSPRTSFDTVEKKSLSIFGRVASCFAWCEVTVKVRYHQQQTKDWILNFQDWITIH